MSFKIIKKGDNNDLVGDWQSFLRGEKLYFGLIDDCLKKLLDVSLLSAL